MARPKKIKNAEELEKKISEYKEYLYENNRPPTMAGLAYYTGIDRKTLFNYNKSDEFFPTLKRFVEWIMMNWEEKAMSDSSSGLIFLLKNYGYTDKQEIVNSGEITTNITVSRKAIQEAADKLKEDI